MVRGRREPGPDALPDSDLEARARGARRIASPRASPYVLKRERYPMAQRKVKQNKVRRLLDQDQQVFGAWLLIPTTVTVEIAAYAGLDFVVVDNEQSSFNEETIADMIRTAEM